MKIDIGNVLKGSLGIGLISLLSWVGTTIYEADTQLGLQEYKIIELEKKVKHLEDEVHLLLRKKGSKNVRQNK